MSTFQKVQALSLKTTRAKVTDKQTNKQTERKTDIENYNIDILLLLFSINKLQDKLKQNDIPL